MNASPIFPPTGYPFPPTGEPLPDLAESFDWRTGATVPVANAAGSSMPLGAPLPLPPDDVTANASPRLRAYLERYRGGV